MRTPTDGTQTSVTRAKSICESERVTFEKNKNFSCVARWISRFQAGGFDQYVISRFVLRELDFATEFTPELNIWYGGSGRYSDTNLLDLIFEKAEVELESDPNVKNVISFFDLTPDTVSENALVVYGGFEGCKQEYVFFISPKGKH